MRTWSLTVLLLTILASIACSGDTQEKSEVGVIILKGEDGRTVFELLMENHKVDYMVSDMGIFIKSIDGIENKGGRFWMYSINDEPGKIACNKAQVSDGDVIKWEFK
ncbi:MAG: DUF4430 domain-containing protein [candidate division Zixibacteria bacterium]|nr:DUF4430 domain-containing protein [candidate division Zixibacteria bacterium]